MKRGDTNDPARGGRTALLDGAAAPRAHMEKRPTETRQQHRERLSRSCYRCGTQYDDLAALDAHEDLCGSAHR